MKIKTLVLGIFFLTFIWGDQVETKTYEKRVFSIQYPENWELKITEQQGSQFILYSELEKNDTFRENINLLVQNLEGMNMTMEKYVKLSESQITTMVEGGKILENKSIDGGKNQKHLLIWKGTMSGVKMMFKQFFFIKNDNAYVLTYTALPETYERYLKEGEPILDSFKLK